VLGQQSKNIAKVEHDSGCQEHIEMLSSNPLLPETHAEQLWATSWLNTTPATSATTATSCWEIGNCLQKVTHTPHPLMKQM
jgi:hypothetical protein